MRYVVIVETAGDSTSYDLPPHYPIKCVEFATREEAEAAYPGKRTLSVEAYSGYQEALAPFYEASLVPDSPWWAFWQR